MDVPEERPNESMLGLGLRLVYRMYRMHPIVAAVAILGAFLTALGIVLSTVVIGQVVDRVIVPAFETNSQIGLREIGWGIAAIVAVAVLRLAGTGMRRFFAGVTTQRVERSLRERLGEYYLGLPMEFHQRAMAGRLLAHADNDAMMATNVLDPVPFSIGVVFLMIFAAISLFLVDPLIAAVAILIFPAMYVINRIYTARVARPTAAVQAGVGRVSSIAHESFDGALVVKTLGRAKQESDRFSAASARLRRDRVEVGNLRAVFEAVLDSLPSLGIAVVVLIGAFRIRAGAMTSGELVQVSALFTLLSLPMRVFGYFLEMVPRSVISHKRLQTVWAENLTEQSFEPVGPDGSAASVVSQVLKVAAVSYTYPGIERLDDDEAILLGEPVERIVSKEPTLATLTNVTFEVRPGEIVAIVGSTGAGKSTLCSLLAGLVEPTSGSVRLGGVDVSTFSPLERANAIALAFQEAFLFADTIAENIALQDPDLKRIREAARLAAADSFIEEMPAKYQTVVGERGVTLSGGQRQRVALARALYRKPRLIILDDATSAVDPVIEQQILNSLRSEVGLTAIIVAQRLSTILLADRIVYLDEGVVAAEGTHEQLMGHAGYRALIEAYEEMAA